MTAITDAQGKQTEAALMRRPRHVDAAESCRYAFGTCWPPPKHSIHNVAGTRLERCPLARCARKVNVCAHEALLRSKQEPLHALCSLGWRTNLKWETIFQRPRMAALLVALKFFPAVLAQPMQLSTKSAWQLPDNVRPDQSSTARC
eukprot:790968-Amphidinium_carterae.1